MTNSFHETSITSKHEGVVIHEVSAKPFAEITFGNCHSDCVGKTLTKWTSRDFNAIRVTNLWMARSL